MFPEKKAPVGSGPALSGVRILIGHGHMHVLTGLKRLLTEEGNAAAVAEAASLEEMLSFIKSGNWQVIVLGSSLAGPSIRDQLAVIRESDPEIRCVLLSSYPHAGINALLVEYGADAVVMEERIAEDLIPVIQSLRRGECVSRRGNQEDSARMAEGLRGEPPVPALSSTDLGDVKPLFVRRKNGNPSR